MVIFTRLNLLAIISAFTITLGSGASAQPWKSVDPSSAGWPVEQLKAAQDYAATLKPTAVMVVHSGEVIASWGEVTRKVNVASVRKSLLSAL
ncbi:hypothetical protein [Rhizobium sp. ZPR3]|uniref:Serine hydrolase n=2 Tax=unclassified Rhizobium TaxID=2613769 RepID=A0AAU7SRD9_9HYPH